MELLSDAANKEKTQPKAGQVIIDCLIKFTQLLQRCVANRHIKPELKAATGIGCIIHVS